MLILLLVPPSGGGGGSYLINHFNNFSLPLNGGYFIAGSNQVGDFNIAFLWLKVSKEYLP